MGWRDEHAITCPTKPDIVVLEVAVMQYSSELYCKAAKQAKKRPGKSRFVRKALVGSNPDKAGQHKNVRLCPGLSGSKYYTWR